jgi:4a-hydroxytetrahydrobiopterin dehydratase
MGDPLAQRKCKPCEGGTTPLPPGAARRLLADVTGWELVDGTAIRKTVKCKDFLDAVGLIQRIAPVAEAEDHHPDLHLTGYRKLAIELSTHAIGGLSENDFILAAKIDQLL